MTITAFQTLLRIATDLEAGRKSKLTVQFAWQLVCLVLVSEIAAAQDAELEVRRVFGECTPIYASAQDDLNLFRRPDLRSKQLRLQYQKGWRIPTDKQQGITRVIEIGKLRVLKDDERLDCPQPPAVGPPTLVVGETVEYLFYLGEGMGRVRFRGAECSSQVVEDFAVYETLQWPEVQVWFRVFFADGSSPGWLLLDGQQIVVSDVLC
ncbi:MAG: hypothetical protein AAF358_11600 [Pseudomonadota bacterium]